MTRIAIILYDMRKAFYCLRWMLRNWDDYSCRQKWKRMEREVHKELIGK